ncbi:MAG: hypothetical protein DMD72_12055 [Gemmatimonadetes bacterium]|nr:MAG: hypothetical protein DMD72_12055 [Gemmatimonadota bacterium]
MQFIGSSPSFSPPSLPRPLAVSPYAGAQSNARGARARDARQRHALLSSMPGAPRSRVFRRLSARHLAELLPFRAQPGGACGVKPRAVSAAAV